MIKRTPSDTKFIVVTLLLVLLLGVRTVGSLMDEDYQQNADYKAETVTGPLASATRAPASIPALQPLLDLDLSCSKKVNSAFKISGNFVQFKGKNCLKNFKQDKIEIINKSNGYTASIFPFGQNQYQTDMIQLIKGENEITIRYVAPSGGNYEKTIKVSSTSI